MKRTDATMVAFYGAELLRRGGAESLRSVFGQFLEKKESFDRWGCTGLMLSESVSEGLSRFIRDQGKTAQRKTMGSSLNN